MSWWQSEIYAGDLSAELGFGRSMPPEFWQWCEKRGLRPTFGKPMMFNSADVRRAMRG